MKSYQNNILGGFSKSPKNIRLKYKSAIRVSKIKIKRYLYLIRIRLLIKTCESCLLIYAKWIIKNLGKISWLTTYHNNSILSFEIWRRNYSLQSTLSVSIEAPLSSLSLPKTHHCASLSTLRRIRFKSHQLVYSVIESLRITSLNRVYPIPSISNSFTNSHNIVVEIYLIQI